MRILCVGDYISDIYTFGHATRLCPEAPVPVLTFEREEHRDGGAGLVVAQLRELLGDDQMVNWIFGSESTKYRYFSGNQMLLRIDYDSVRLNPVHYNPEKYDAFVVCDYGKGCMTEELAKKIVQTGKPCFVDAKPHWHWYAGSNVTIFPNSREAQPVPPNFDPTTVVHSAEYGAIVHKQGERGAWYQGKTMQCSVLPACWAPLDVTGAGDVFMAGFVWGWLLELKPQDCLSVANELAGESCRHLGTYVVPKAYAQSVLDKVQLSLVFEPQGQVRADDSNGRERPLAQQDLVEAVSKSGNLPEDSARAQSATTADHESCGSAQIPPIVPSSPILFDGNYIREDRLKLRAILSRESLRDRYPIGSEHQCERTPARGPDPDE